MDDPVKTTHQQIRELAELRGKVRDLRDENAASQAECRRFRSALHESESRFAALLFNLPERVFWKDHNSVYVSCNRNYAADCRTTVDEIAGKTDYDLFPAEIAAKYRADDQRIMATGETEEIEERYCAAAGEERLIRTVKAPLRDNAGRVIGVLGVFTDITERKRAEQALQQSEARYRALTEATRDIIYILDREGTLRYANRAALQCIGVPADEILGKRQVDLFSPETAQAHLERIRRVIDAGETVEEDESLAFGAETLWFRIHLLPLRDDAGNVMAVMGVNHNITARKRAEEALQTARDELEQRIAQRTAELTKSNELLRAEVRQRREAEKNLAMFRSFVEAATQGFGMADLTGQIIYVNPFLARLLGAEEPEDIIGTQVTDYYPPGYQEQREKNILPVLQRHEAWHGEQLMMFSDGQMHPTIHSVFPILDENGELFCVASVITDITKIKQAQESLRQSYHHLRASEERFELVVRSSGVGIWDWDVCTGQVYFSPRWKELFGYDDDEIGNSVEDWARLVHPDDHDWVLQFQADFLAGSRSTVAAEYRLRHKDGSYRWIIAHGLVVRDKDGRACRLVGSHGDITDRKWAEEALEQSEAKYRALIECCPDAVAVINLEGRIVFASERAAEQHGYQQRNDMIGLASAELVAASDRDRFLANARLLLDEAVHRNVEYTMLRRDGTTFEAEVSSAVMRDAAGHPEALMGVYRDVTERKQTERRLKAKNAELYAAAEIQATLLPQAAPQVPGFDIAGRCYPAEAAAGDHFDFLPRPDGSLLIVMGDVSSHGLGPAIVAADFCARVRTLAETACELPEMAAKLNAGLYRETDGEIFVTGILGRLEPDSMRLTCLNAGHPPAVVLSANGDLKTSLVRGSLPFAILPDTPFVVDEAVELAEGDIVLLYTDGLIEVRRAGYPQFGLERALQVVREDLQRSAAEMVEALHRAACQYAGTSSASDDITVIILKALGRAPARSADAR